MPSLTTARTIVESKNVPLASRSCLTSFGSSKEHAFPVGETMQSALDKNGDSRGISTGTA